LQQFSYIISNILQYFPYYGTQRQKVEHRTPRHDYGHVKPLLAVTGVKAEAKQRRRAACPEQKVAHRRKKPRGHRPPQRAHKVIKKPGSRPEDNTGHGGGELTGHRHTHGHRNSREKNPPSAGTPSSYSTPSMRPVIITSPESTKPWRKYFSAPRIHRPTETKSSSL